MDEILKIETIDEYNKMFDYETLHPLVNIVEFKGAKKSVHSKMNYGFYTLFLKNTKCGDIRYGRTTYDYTDGTVVSMAPGQVVSINVDPNVVNPSAVGLLFHPNFIHGTQLGRNIKKYSFFSYNSTEALHLSEQEIKIVNDCLNNIKQELKHGMDKHSKYLILMNIELLLNYCMRFYERQFTTRETSNKDVLSKFETLIDDYYQNEMQLDQGLPTVKYFADEVCLSPNYFGDLIKKETGKSPQEYILYKVIEMGKDMILESDKSVSEIAYHLGFQYPQHFSRFFKQKVGCTPSNFRNQIYI